MRGYRFSVRPGFPRPAQRMAIPDASMEEGAAGSAAGAEAPDRPLPRCFHRLLWEDTEAFPGQHVLGLPWPLFLLGYEGKTPAQTAGAGGTLATDSTDGSLFCANTH